MCGMDRQTRREQMLGWIEVRRREGLSFRALSERSGIPQKTLHRWAARFRDEEPSSDGLRASRGSSFVELIEVPSTASSRIEIVLGRDRRVSVPNEFDEATLVRVVRALERC